MVLMVQPLREAIRAAKAEIGADTAVLYLSPQGRRLDHAGAVELAARDRMILVCGRYEGVDERLITAEIDEEWSIGDYVLSGGELAAMVIIDALTRFIPGVLGHADSAREDSFAEGLLDCPHYTRPEELDGLRVPAVLLGGNHEQIRRWRLKQSLGRTWLRRPEMLFSADLDDERRVLLKEFVTEYVKDIAGQKHEQHHWTNRSGADDPPAPRFWAG
jgi:tRNA (guanine37-N1)-methyltransferase